MERRLKCTSLPRTGFDIRNIHCRRNQWILHVADIHDRSCSAGGVGPWKWGDRSARDSGAAYYRLQVADNASFPGTLIFDDQAITATSRQVGPLSGSQTYYWRVRARNSGWVTDWSPVRSATVMSQPVVYDLFQNHPNPCNPVTVIRYDVPVQSQVSLILYDLLGQQVRTLVDAVMKPGRYEDLVDMKNLPSGMFIYRLITRPVPGPNQPLTDPISFTKKLMIVR